MMFLSVSHQNITNIVTVKTSLRPTAMQESARHQKL